MIGFQQIPNEVIGAFILDGLRRSDRLAKAQRDATITLPPRDCAQIVPAHIDAAAMKKETR